MKNNFFLFLLACLLVFSSSTVIPAQAEDNINDEISIKEVGASESDVNTATDEDYIIINQTGMLIEIGNTTAEQTTIIVRVNNDGVDEDLTLEITSDTKLYKSNSSVADLSDWIAGDQINFTAQHFTNSDQLVATSIKNLSFNQFYTGINGWITAIRADENEMDVEWNDQVYTINAINANMVAGLKNPATLNDFVIGDRVRARVTDDGDGNRLTWDGEIVVVLRRGEDLFMRVTRWVVPGVIVAMPADLTLPATIDVEVLDSNFYEARDVNNLIGAPGTIIQVDITEDTELVRRYLGYTNLEEFNEGDVIRIVGRRDENTGHLTAKVIKNNNIQRLGVANKEARVISIDESNSTITVEVVIDGATHQYTIYSDDDTAFIKLGQDIDLSGIAIDDEIRVRGTFRRSDATVLADHVSVIVRRDNIPDDISDVEQLKNRFALQIHQLKEETKRFQDLLKDRFDAFREGQKAINKLKQKLQLPLTDDADEEGEDN